MVMPMDGSFACDGMDARLRVSRRCITGARARAHRPLCSDDSSLRVVTDAPRVHCADAHRESVRQDLILIHPPSVFEFRERSIVYGPVSDVIPSSSVFEMYPVGFLTLAAWGF